MDQKNFIVAIVLSVLIIVGWQAVFPPTKTPPPVATTQTAAPAGAPAAAPGAASPPGAPGAPQAPGTAAAPATAMTLEQALAQSPRVTFSTPELLGSIALK